MLNRQKSESTDSTIISIPYSLKVSIYKNLDFSEWKEQNICHILVGNSTK